MAENVGAGASERLKLGATIRAAVLTGFPEAAGAVGLDPLRMLDAVGIPRTALREPDLRISLTALRELLERAGRASEDFGLRLSLLRTPSIMGPVALIAREQPTLRSIIQTIARYITLYTDALDIRVEETGEVAIIRIGLTFPTQGPQRQTVELATGQLMRLLRQHLGPNWRPVNVSFVHAQPRSMDTHRRALGANIAFDQDFDGVVCERSDLDHVNPAADPAMAREIERYIQGLAGSSQASMPDRVRALAQALLPMGHCTFSFVSKQMGLDPRTLQRQLAGHGTSFLDIVQAARMALTIQYVDESDRPLVEVADLLGFSAISAFSRWHRTHYGNSPSDRRANPRGAAIGPVAETPC